MTEMVEPDRTIMIVSIIGLVIIWGSFFYHKFVQGGQKSVAGRAESGGSEGREPEKAVEIDISADSSPEPDNKSKESPPARKKKKKKNRR